MSNALLNTRAPRLKLLQDYDKHRSWSSLAEHRTCVLCGSEFAGESIVISVRSGKASFGCPTPDCRGSLHHFVHAGNPLLEEDIWQEWMECSTGLFAVAENSLLESWDLEQSETPNS